MPAALHRIWDECASSGQAAPLPALPARDRKDRLPPSPGAAIRRRPSRHHRGRLHAMRREPCGGIAARLGAQWVVPNGSLTPAGPGWVGEGVRSNSHAAAGRPPAPRRWTPHGTPGGSGGGPERRRGAVLVGPRDPEHDAAQRVPARPRTRRRRPTSVERRFGTPTCRLRGQARGLEGSPPGPGHHGGASRPRVGAAFLRNRARGETPAIGHPCARTRGQGPPPRTAVSAGRSVPCSCRPTLLLFPSIRDSAPWAVGEALWAGCPVVCLRTAGAAELVQRGGGLAIEPTEPLPRRLAEALASDVNVASSPGALERRRAIGAAPGVVRTGEIRMYEPVRRQGARWIAPVLALALLAVVLPRLLGGRGESQRGEPGRSDSPQRYPSAVCRAASCGCGRPGPCAPGTRREPPSRSAPGSIRTSRSFRNRRTRSTRRRVPSSTVWVSLRARSASAAPRRQLASP